MLLITALIISCFLTSCQRKEEPAPDEGDSSTIVDAPFRVQTMVESTEKTNIEFWEDGLQQYFDKLSLWASNQEGSVSFNFDIDINNQKYTIDLVFSYTTIESKVCNAVFSIKNNSKTYNIIIKDNDIYYIWNGYKAVEKNLLSLENFTNALPISSGTTSSIGNSLRLAIKTEEKVKHGVSVATSTTTEEYIADIKIKETLDTLNRHLEEETQSFIIDFINTNCSTNITSLDKDDNQIDAQFPDLDIRFGYVAARNPVANMPNSPTELYLTFKSPISTKSAFNGQEQNVSVVFTQKYQTTTYQDNTIDVLPLDTSTFVAYKKDAMASSLENKTIVTIIELLQSALNTL